MEKERSGGGGTNVTWPDLFVAQPDAVNLALSYPFGLRSRRVEDFMV
jgi:hypothetical protein